MAEEIQKHNKGSSQGGGRPFRSRGPGGRPERAKPEYDQKVLDVRRVARVVRGGRRFSFSLIMAIGNRRGRVGLGVGKAADVSQAVEKATRNAKKNLIDLNLTKTFSIPHEVEAKFGSSYLIMKPSPGRGLAAGSSVRAILALGGVKDITAKIHSKSKNRLNNARVAMVALKNFAK